jgi:hypothetical protein
MHATLHLPDATPRLLTNAELTSLNMGESLHPQHAASLRELLGTAIPAELLASEPGRYAIIVPENAADYDFGPTPSAEADFMRLTGAELDEPLTGPILIIEA